MPTPSRPRCALSKTLQLSSPHHILVSCPAAAPKSDGPARLVNVGNRLELDLEPLLTASSGPLKRCVECRPLKINVFFFWLPYTLVM